MVRIRGSLGLLSLACVGFLLSACGDSGTGTATTGHGIEITGTSAADQKMAADLRDYIDRGCRGTGNVSALTRTLDGGRLRPERGTEWDDAELGVVPRLRELGYRDAFRALHGYAKSEPSWTWRRIAGHDGGWRLDHLFASEELRPSAATYHHAWRDQGLSDHSALEVDLQSRRS